MLALLVSPLPIAPVDKPKKIVVVGTGLAGLAAAKRLSDQGHQVTVLEARDRIGGRIWTSKKWPDLPLDLGATWIHGVTKNPITEIADQIGAKRIRTSYDSAVLLNSNGKELSELDAQLLQTLRMRLGQAVRKAQRAEEDASLLSVARSVPVGPGAHGAALIEFLVNSEFEQEYGGAADSLSAHYFDSAKEFEGSDVLFADGFEVIVKHLAKGLDVRLKQVVQEIDFSEEEIVVTTSKGTFEADQVLVTLPLGVLQSGRVTFNPELPIPKSRAIRRLKMGVLNKCYLRFPRVFWPADVDWIEILPAKAGQWVEWVSFAKAAKRPVLLGFNAAQRGREIESLSDQALVDDAMKSLRNAFGKDIPDPTDWQITRWARDPYARGSYSYNALGATPKDREALAAPVGDRLFFAGEATSKDFFGTAHGALISGVAAAEQMLKLTGP